MTACAGIGLKPEHYRGLLAERPPLGFVELHVENYMGAGGPPHRYLEQIAALYPLSFHGVGMSLGGVDALDRRHLAAWRALVDRYSPALVSEHVAWVSHAGVALHDLLPIPYSREALRVIAEHIDEMQNALGRHILIENPSRYVELDGADMDEAEFLVETARRTGCLLLLDVNNAYVSTRNQGTDPAAYLERIPADLVAEIHLAGHSLEIVDGRELRIDDHGSPVAAPVWELFRDTVARIGARPTLVEWDTDVPELAVMLAEAARADAVAASAHVPAREPQHVNAG